MNTQYRTHWSQQELIGNDSCMVYLIDARKIDGCWQFWRKSMFDVDWYAIQPTSELVRKAEQLTAPPVGVATTRHRCRPSFGLSVPERPCPGAPVRRQPVAARTEMPVTVAIMMVPPEPRRLERAAFPSFRFPRDGLGLERRPSGSVWSDMNLGHNVRPP